MRPNVLALSGQRVDQESKSWFRNGGVWISPALRLGDRKVVERERGHKTHSDDEQVNEKIKRSPLIYDETEIWPQGSARSSSPDPETEFGWRSKNRRRAKNGLPGRKKV